MRFIVITLKSRSVTSGEQRKLAECSAMRPAISSCSAERGDGMSKRLPCSGGSELMRIVSLFHREKILRHRVRSVQSGGVSGTHPSGCMASALGAMAESSCWNIACNSRNRDVESAGQLWYRIYNPKSEKFRNNARSASISPLAYLASFGGPSFPEALKIPPARTIGRWCWTQCSAIPQPGSLSKCIWK